MSIEAVRRDQIGEDHKGRRFYFSPQGCETGRLYCEQQPDSQTPGVVERGAWRTICTTAAQMQMMARRLEGSQHEGEKDLHTKLTGEIIPMVRKVARCSSGAVPGDHTDQVASRASLA
jgi:hypothetical protein